MNKVFPIDAVAQGLLRGLGWLNENLPNFSFADCDRADPPFAKAYVARLKPISELALTVWILKRCGLQVPFLDSAAEWAWQECEQGRRLVALLLARNDFLPCCALYAPLFQLGYRCEALDIALAMLSRSTMAAALPLQPWSKLAMRYNLWQLGLSRCPGTAKDLYIQARPEPWVISGEVAYAITHEVFYLTDFGFRPLQDRDVRDYLKTWTPYWAKSFAAEGDDDLTAEFAMVSTCLDDSDAHDVAATLLLTVLSHQRADGSMTGPQGAGSFLFADDDSLSRREFLASYHTTLVALMAAALAVRLRRS
ncbi:DUF6895 family protein [Paraburkholderia strydomiana]|uniref:DUF6895 domain-containing protein n=1 Tax=Paraburkholderia strydomiana TaxID=1245417 RepID=A0ABW9C1D8_9BURK